MLSDIITGFMMQNPEFKAYAMHNFFHMKKFFLRKIGIKHIKATKVQQDVEFGVFQPEAVPVISNTNIVISKVA